ncbi:MAG TPA: L-threonylcarbamoyladenylate synthase [Methylomirabilota bacterium]|jgi:tRNA threonylcarbamoyl adenosine modification protein (Sua5/YciO/YrdC/YwlC family)|nr:L-threonylcarbamoyladenylate synthase [Methylomirabilota bacterium]
MEILKVDSAKPDRRALDAAAEAVLRGGVIAFPTDTVYGLGCSLLDVAAVEMVGRLKRRAREHAYISLIPDPSQALGLALSVSGVAKKLIDRFWPGPLSLVFVAAEIVPGRVRGSGGTIALRCPNDVLSHALLQRIGGPMVSSSANLSGQPPAATADDVVATFGNQLDLVLDGGPRRGGIPSTLVDVSGPRPKLLRRGALDVTAFLGEFDDLARERG